MRRMSYEMQRWYKKSLVDDKQFEDMPKWKQIIFMKKQKTRNNQTYQIINMKMNLKQTMTIQTMIITMMIKTINGEMIAGRVDNADDVKQNLTSLTLNDSIKYIIDLLENKHINKKETTKYTNDDIVDMIDMILSKLKEMKNDTYNTDNDEAITTINKSLI